MLSSSMQTDSSTTFVLIYKSPRRHIPKHSNLKKRKTLWKLNRKQFGSLREDKRSRWRHQAITTTAWNVKWR